MCTFKFTVDELELNVPSSPNVNPGYALVLDIDINAIFREMLCL